MNENLVELAIEANDETGNNFDLNYKPLEELLAKFAWFIVLECASIAEDYPHSEKMLEHFGVE